MRMISLELCKMKRSLVLPILPIIGILGAS